MATLKAKYLTLATAGMLTLSLTGCASIFGDNNRVVHIDSAPKDAKVKVNGIELENKTPTDTKITNMWSPTVIEVKKPGCASKTVSVTPEFQMIGILNVLFLPAFVVDAATGNMFKVPENQHNINIKLC